MTPQRPTLRIEPASSSTELAWARMLFREYQASIGIDLCFQGFEQELAELPGAYCAPYGGLFLAWVHDTPAGCCAFRGLPDVDYVNACEMKRLFVLPGYRGWGIGRQLVETVRLQARQAGYDVMLLDTLSDMEAARALYAQAGFEEIAPYYHNPLAGAHYLKLML